MATSPEPVTNDAASVDGDAARDIDALLIDYILQCEDEDGGEYILLGEEPSELGDEVIGIVVAKISDHLALSRRMDIDRVRSSLIGEYRRADRTKIVMLDHLAGYVRAMASTPRDARLCLLDVAWGLRDAGYRTSLDGQGPQKVQHGDPLSLRRLHRPKGDYVVESTVAADRPWERVVRNTLRLSLCLATWLVASSCVGF